MLIPQPERDGDQKKAKDSNNHWPGKNKSKKQKTKSDSSFKRMIFVRTIVVIAVLW